MAKCCTPVLLLLSLCPHPKACFGSGNTWWQWQQFFIPTIRFAEKQKKAAETTLCRSTIQIAFQHGLDNAHHWHFEGKYLLRELISSIDNSITNTAHSYKARKGPFNSISHWIINKQRVKTSEMSNQNHLYFPNSLVVCIKVERI